MNFIRGEKAIDRLMINNEAAVQRVMQEFGFDRLQAERHVAERQRVQERLSRERDSFPLGRNAMIDHDAEYASWAARNPELAALQATRQAEPIHGVGHMQGRGAA